MKKYILAILVGSLLLGGVAQADTFIPQCRPAKGSGLVDCPGAYVDDTDNTWYIDKAHIFWDLQVDNVLNANEVNTHYVSSDNGYFTDLEVGHTLTVATVTAQYLQTQGLYVVHDAIIDGNLDIVGYIKANAAEFLSLVMKPGGVIAFWDNPYASITAMSTGLKFIANQILTMVHDGKGSCDVSKNLTNGGTRWEWTDNSGVRQSATSLAGVPTQCLATP